VNKLSNILFTLPSEKITDAELSILLQGTKDRRYGLVKRALKNQDLIHIRRGLYSLGLKYQRQGLNLFDLAHRIYGPSFVSLESALSYHGWIPEGVYTVTSVTIKRPTEFHTPLEVFSYQKIPSKTSLFGVDRIQEGSNVFYMARPWRALVDYVYMYKKNWKEIDPLIFGMRIEKENLTSMPWLQVSELGRLYQSRRVSRFLKGIQKDLFS